MSRGRVVARAMVVSSGWLDNAGVAGRSVMVTFVDVTKISDLQTVNDQVTRLNLELSDNIKKAESHPGRNGEGGPHGAAWPTHRHRCP